MPTAARVLVDTLASQGTQRVFCVPGESFLAVLDALYDSPIRSVVCRQEGGAAMMAEADGKLRGRPGIALVTRGPGASNALSGVHVAQQDSTPLILLVGQIERGMRGRDAFQEVDFNQLFGGMAKWVAELDAAERVPEMLSRAFHTAMAGRPGPVVLTLPEDMLRETCDAEAPDWIEVSEPGPSEEELERLESLLSAGGSPLVVAGGSRWSESAVEDLRLWSEKLALPVACSFRRQMLFDASHPHYAGDIGLGVNPALKKRLFEADPLILLGGRFSENPSQNYTALAIPTPQRRLVHVHPGPEELGRVYHPTLGINATPGRLLRAALQRPAPQPLPWADQVAAAHDSFLDWNRDEGEPEDSLAGQLQRLRAHLPADAIVTNGAGNYAIWLHRFWRYPRFLTQLAPTSGSMGYGLPAAVAAKLAYPERAVVCFAGDGCVQMTQQEFGTAVQEEAPVIVVVIDNGMYGTIRMHQERSYPGRISATDLRNPDFAALARAYGGHGETVEKLRDFMPAFERAEASGKAAILHVKTDPEQITPSATLRGLREAASSKA